MATKNSLSPQALNPKPWVSGVHSVPSLSAAALLLSDSETAQQVLLRGVVPPEVPEEGSEFGTAPTCGFFFRSVEVDSVVGLRA